VPGSPGGSSSTSSTPSVPVPTPTPGGGLVPSLPLPSLPGITGGGAATTTTIPPVVDLPPVGPITLCLPPLATVGNC
jgi:hypothetical protein